MYHRPADGWTVPRGILTALLPVLVGMSLHAPLPARQPAGAGLVAPKCAAGRLAANKEIARGFLLAIASKDVAALRAALAPDAHLTLMIAGVYSPELHAFPRGTRWGRDGIVNMAVDRQRDREGRLAVQIISMLGEGDLIAAEVVGRGIHAGRPYVQHYSYHFQLNAGRITDIRLYQDTFLLWNVWDNSGPEAQPPYDLTNEANVKDPTGAEEQQVLRESVHNSDPAMVASNKESVRSFLTAVRTRNISAERAVWAPQGVWSFAVGGDYLPPMHAFRGAPRWDREAMIAMQQSSQAMLKEPLTIDIYSLIGEGNEVSAEAVGFLVRADGRAYRQHYSLHFKARDGKLLEGHVYQDTLHQYDLSREPGKIVAVAGLIPP